MSISEFLPTISSEQERKIRELAYRHQQYIDAILEYSDYSFVDYLNDVELGELGVFYDELDEMGVGFGCSAKTEIIGCSEIAFSNTGKGNRCEWFTLV